MTAAGDTITGAAFDRADNPNCCIALRTATQNIVSGGAGTLLSLDSEEFDNAGMFTPTSTNVTIAADGVYLVTFYTEWQPNATGYRGIDILINAVAAAGLTVAIGTATPTTRATATNTFLLTAGDVLTFNCTQNSGSTLTVTARVGVTRISG
jgi:hypothetical protein